MVELWRKSHPQIEHNNAGMYSLEFLCADFFHGNLLTHQITTLYFQKNKFGTKARQEHVLKSTTVT